MKRSIRNQWKKALFFCIFILLFTSIFTVAASAKGELPGGAEVEDVMQFVGVEAEYTGLNGLRAVFTVKDREIDKLEEMGYTVSYGAIVGYRSTYYAPTDLNVDRKTNAAMIRPYREGRRGKGYWLDSADDESKFAIVTFFGSEAEAADANRALVYRGFIELQREGYTTEYYYVNGKDAVIGDDISLYNVLAYLQQNSLFTHDGVYDLLDRLIQSTKVYVDPEVAVSGDGLTAETAVKTVKEGYEKAVALINAAEVPTRVMIELAPGKHHLSEKINIKGNEIQTDLAYSIIFAGSKTEEKSVITSCHDIDAAEFKKTDGARYYQYQFPETVKVGGAYPRFRDLYIDNQPATLATSQGLFYMLLDSCNRAEENGLNADDRLLYVSPDALGAVEVDANGNVIGTLEFWVQTDWQVHCVRIEHIDYGRQTDMVQNGQELIAIRVRKDDWNVFKPAYYSTLAGCRYWFQNNKAYVDEKGEFWYDDQTGTIYMIPFAALNDTDAVSYPTCERLFHLDSAKNITFQNLDICGTTVNYVTEYGFISGQGGRIKREWINPDTGAKEKDFWLPYGAIYAKNASDIRIQDCSIYNVGGDAVNFRGAVDRVRIYGSSFENVGSCGIRLGVNKVDFTKAQHNENIIIRENYLQNIATNFNSSPSILVSSVRNMDITHNTILDSAYTAISVGWRWGRYTNTNIENTHIEYNYIENFLTKTQDGGAIYTLGGNAPLVEDRVAEIDYLNTMSHNYVVLTPETGNGSGHFTVFYHDQGSSHWLAEQNILIAGPDAQGTDHSYVAYQSIAPCTYNNKHTGMIFVGTQKEALPFSDPDDNGDGSITYYDLYLIKIADYVTNNRFEYLYMFRDFARLTGTPQEAIVKETAEKAGCSGYHPTYGEWSAKK